jgi:hypothetical protein
MPIAGGLQARAFIALAVSAVCAAAACADKHERPDPRCVEDGDKVKTTASPADDASPPTSTDPPLGGICDGSDEIRLVVATHLGPGTVPWFIWQDYHSRPLLIVDGHCHFYAVDLSLSPVSQGQLTPELLEQITKDLALGDLPNLPSRRDNCTDHWEDRILATQDHALRCRCNDCGEGTPSTRAIENGIAWIDKLVEIGEPSTGVLKALASPGEPVMGEGIRTQPVFDWPLEAAVHNVAGLVTDGHWTAASGVFFEGDDAAALRKLRSKTAAWDLFEAPDEELHPSLAYVRDCGQTYALNMRDELPARVEAQLEALLEVAWKRPKIESCITDFSSMTPTSPCPPE